jgi:hypothetical protein
MANKKISDLISAGAVADADLLEMSQYNGVDYDSRSLSISTLRGGLLSFVTEQFVLTGTDITNGYVLLASDPVSEGSVDLKVLGAGEQIKDVDWEVDSGDPNRISWTSLGLDGLLSSGDTLSIKYVAG